MKKESDLMRELTQELEHWINHSCLRGEPRQTPQRAHCISKGGGQKNTKTWRAVGDQNRGRRDMFLVAKGKQNHAAGRVSSSHFSETLNLSRKDLCNLFLEVLEGAWCWGLILTVFVHLSEVDDWFHSLAFFFFFSTIFLELSCSFTLTCSLRWLYWRCKSFFNKRTNELC